MLAREGQVGAEKGTKMKFFPILAICLLIVCFAAYIPFVGIALSVGLMLLGAGTLVGMMLHQGWKKLSGKV